MSEPLDSILLVKYDYNKLRDNQTAILTYLSIINQKDTINYDNIIDTINEFILNYIEEFINKLNINKINFDGITKVKSKYNRILSIKFTKKLEEFTDFTNIVLLELLMIPYFIIYDTDLANNSFDNIKKFVELFISKDLLTEEIASLINKANTTDEIYTDTSSKSSFLPTLPTLPKIFTSSSETISYKLQALYMKYFISIFFDLFVITRFIRFFNELNDKTRKNPNTSEYLTSKDFTVINDLLIANTNVSKTTDVFITLAKILMECQYSCKPHHLDMIKKSNSMRVVLCGILIPNMNENSFKLVISPVATPNPPVDNITHQDALKVDIDSPPVANPPSRDGGSRRKTNKIVVKKLLKSYK